MTTRPKETNPPQSEGKKFRIVAVYRKKWFPAALFLVLTLLYFLPYLSFDKVLVGTDDGPRGWHTKKNMLHHLESFSDKWSPLNGGTALMERRFGRFLTPTYVLHLILPRYAQRTLEYIFWVFLAGLFAFLYMRALRISRGVSIVCAVGFMFAPGLLSNIITGHWVKMEVIALMPGVMYFAERMLRRFSLVNLAGLPILIALTIYSEHLQLAFFVLMGMGAYYLVRIIHSYVKKELSLPESLKRGGLFGAALIVSVLITSMTTFPPMHHTSKVSQRAGGVGYDYAQSYALNPEEVLMLLEPDFLGWGERYWGQNSLKLNTEYFGVLFVILAMSIFVLGKMDVTQWTLAALAFFALLFSLGGHTPVHRLAYHLIPPIRSFRAPSMMYIWIYLPVMVLAGMALDQLLRINWKENKQVRKRFLIFAAIVGGLAFIYMITFGGFAQMWYDSFFPPELKNQGKAAALEKSMDQIKLGGFLIFAFVTALFALIYYKAKGAISAPTFLLLFTVIILIDDFRISRPFITRSAKPKNFYVRNEKAEQKIAEFLTSRDKGLYRVHSLIRDRKLYILPLDLTYVFDDFTNQYYDQLTRHGRALLQQMFGSAQQSRSAAMVHYLNFLRFLNAKYILSPGALPIPGLTTIANAGQIVIYQTPDVFPRFYLASKIITTHDQQSELYRRMQHPDFSTSLAIVNSKDLPHTLNPAVDTTLTNDIDITTHQVRDGLVELTVTSNREQVLVYGSNYAPGWSAKINGKPTSLFRVNYAWKGIVVGQGVSKVVFEYTSGVAARWRRITLISGILFGIFALAMIAVETRQLLKACKQ
ncbi:MAG: YfhO family protein [Chitinivibrionales bacterium]|nr:YfhO family protein [Chitinivibrionales bacterium]